MDKCEYIMKINNKFVQLSQPYKAPIIDVVGREEEMKMILAAWIGGEGRLPLSPLLLGEPGVGKNRVVYECARVCSKPLYIFQGHEDITAEDLICAVRFEMKEYFRRLVVNHFKDTGLLPEKMARNLLSWKHSGFNIDNSIRILGNDNKAREALSQYIARCPISLNKIIYESFKDKVIFKTKYNAYFKKILKYMILYILLSL